MEQLCITGLINSTTPLFGVIWYLSPTTYFLVIQCLNPTTYFLINTLVHKRQQLETEKNYSSFLYEYNLLLITISEFETELGYLLKDAADSPDLNTFSLLGLHSYFSIFSAKCIALKNAVRLALQSSHDNIFIYSDSYLPCEP